ncbi:MAG: DMT family transporter [Pseudomonadota bacterium]
MSDQLKGILITLLGVLFVVPDSLFVRLIDAPTLTIAFWRTFTQGIVLLCVMALILGRRYPQKIKEVGWVSIPFGVTVTTSGLLFVTAVQYTTVANVVIIIATTPIFAAFFSWLWLGERVSKRMIWTMLFAIIGVVIIGFGSIEPDSNSTLLGDSLALLTAALFAVSITCARSVSPISITPVVPVAFLIMSGVLFFFVDPWNVDPGDWIWVFLHGGIFVAASSALLSYGPKFITSAEVALLILLESIFAPILAWFIIREVPGAWTLWGGSLVLLTLIISNAIALRRAK